MTKLEIIAKVREYFSRPGAEYGYDRENASCVYRLGGEPSSPVRCGIGVLIPDEKYSPRMEGNSVSGFFDDPEYELIDAFYVDDADDWDSIGFFETLRKIHDGCAQRHAPMSEFFALLDEMAPRTARR